MTSRTVCNLYFNAGVSSPIQPDEHIPAQESNAPKLPICAAPLVVARIQTAVTLLYPRDVRQRIGWLPRSPAFSTRNGRDMSLAAKQDSISLFLIASLQASVGSGPWR